jgi:hypothetical protein
MAEKKMSISEKAKSLLADIERHREEAKKEGMYFTGLSEEEVYRKLTKKNSPMIVMQQWTTATAPGGTIDYSVYIHNPDPDMKKHIFGHVFVGPANMASDVSTAVCAVDSRFARLTQPNVPGLKIDPGTTKNLIFALPVPVQISHTNYLGNCFVFKAGYSDVGEYMDRAVFVFRVE